MENNATEASEVTPDEVEHILSMQHELSEALRASGIPHTLEWAYAILALSITVLLAGTDGESDLFALAQATYEAEYDPQYFAKVPVEAAVPSAIDMRSRGQRILAAIKLKGFELTDAETSFSLMSIATASFVRFGVREELYMATVRHVVEGMRPEVARVREKLAVARGEKQA